MTNPRGAPGLADGASPMGAEDRQGVTVLDTFAPVGAMPRRLAQSASDPHLPVVDLAVIRSDMAADAVLVAPARVETRGRKRGSTAHQASLKRLQSVPPPAVAAPAVPVTRREQQSAAGKASAQRRREAKQAADAAGGAATTLALRGVDCGDLVPWVHEAVAQRRDKTLLEQERLQRALAIVDPDIENNENLPVEGGILVGYLKQLSKIQLAKKLGVSRDTLTRRVRLLSFCIVMVRLGWAHSDLQSFDNFLFLHFGEEDVRRMNFICKYKFDEMSMRLKVLTSAGHEYAVAKLLQVVVTWTAMWKVRGSYVRMRFPHPGRIKPIEACTVPVVRSALDHFTTLPPKSKHFVAITRMPVADQHISNQGADDTYSRDMPDELKHRFDCHAHIEKRVADRSFDVFPNEKKGLLHCTLSCNFGGLLLQIKSAMKHEFKEHLIWHDSTFGADVAAAAYRERVFALCCDPAETSDKRSRVAKTTIYYQRRRFLNGRYRRRGRYEHFCANRQCCRDREHCLSQLFQMVDSETGPRQWCVQEWSGMEDCVDWVTFYLLFNDMFEIVYLKVVSGEPSAGVDVVANAVLDAEDEEARAADHEDESDGEATHLPEADLNLPDPTKEDSYERKQSTFRANGAIWLRSKPVGRLFVFRMLIRPQQHGMRTIIKDSSKQEKRKELMRRRAGKPPKYRVTMATEGRYTKAPMQKWSQMLRDELEWSILPMEYRNHELSTHAFRGLCALLCSKHELQVEVLENSFPMKGYKLLSTKAAGTDILVATELIRTYEHDPCVLDARWFDHCERYNTVQKMLSNDSKAEVALHADEADIDNIDTETNNTIIHRSVRRCVQQKLANIMDVAASFAMSSDRQIHTHLFGEKKYTADMLPDNKRVEKKSKARCGGGGLARAFVSAHAAMYRKSNGKLDLAAIWRLYRAEKAKEVSPLLDSLRW